MRTYKVISCITLLYFFMSCGMLQRTTTTSDKDNQEFLSKGDLVTAIDREKNLESQSFTFYTDSINNDYSVQVWPKGNFTYSPVYGFEGEAEKLLINGHGKGLKEGVGISSSKAKETDHAELKLKTVDKGKSEQVATIRKSAPSLWLIVGGLVLLAAVILYFLRLKF